MKLWKQIVLVDNNSSFKFIILCSMIGCINAVKFVNIFPRYLPNIILLNGFHSYLIVGIDCRNLARNE